MTTFVLVPGAGGSAWYWHRLVAELERRGHEAVAVDLPADDETAGLAEYTDTVVAAVGDRAPVVLVAQSMGGLTAPWCAGGCRSSCWCWSTPWFRGPGRPAASGGP